MIHPVNTPHAPAHAGLASALCVLLDVRRGIVADNARNSANTSVYLLAGRLICGGIDGPARAT
jgi:hypothetical protein